MNSILFAKKLVQKRKELGVTQERLAQFIGVSKAAVSKWEKSQSFPDITLLPKLATYLNMSIDELLGYEPQMPRERIRETYAYFAEQFAVKDFDEVEKHIEQLISEYYSCFPLILQMAQLYLNYYKLSDNPDAVLQKVSNHCLRIVDHCSEPKIIQEAEILQSYIELIQGHFENVLHILGEETPIQYGVEQLIASALSMRGDHHEANVVSQVSVYQHMLGLIQNMINLLKYEIKNPVHFDETIDKIETLMDTFSIAKLNANIGFLFYLQAIVGYIQQERMDDAIKMAEKYFSLIMQLQFPIELRGDEYFYLFDEWVVNNIQLGS